MANRYSQVTPSQFNPLSLQEIMITPAMQRQKHDQLLAQQEMLRQGLAKVDPLDVHMNEALNVKSQMENKLRSQADLLSKEGINPNTQGEFLALNREYQNLVSPTGRLGQINAAKQVYAKNFNDYLEDATKNKGWSRERALANWNNFSKQYTGFADDKIANIGQLGAPKKVEVLDVLKDVKGLLGEQVVGEMRASGYNFQPGPDGSMVMVDRSGRRIETSNKPNLQAAQNLINQRLMGKEWQDSIRFEGEDTQNIYGQLTSGINSMLDTKVVDNRSENAQYIAAPKPSASTTQPNQNVFGEDYNTQEIGGKSTDTSNISKIGKKLYGSAQGFLGKSPVSSYTSANLPLKEKAVYDSFWKRATTGDGIMLDGKLVKLNPSLVKKGKDDPIVASQLLRSMKQSPAITLTSKMLTPNQVVGNQGFVAGLGKDAADFDKNIRRQLQRTDNSGRKLVDEKGKTLNWNDAVEEYNLSGINDVNYQGYISPLNWEDNLGQGSNSKFSPHVITAKDKDGNWHTFKTTRLNSDNLGVNTTRQNEITKNYRDATLNYNTWVPIESNNDKLSKYKVKYNPKETEIDPYNGEVKTWVINIPNKGEVKVTESDYLNFMNSNK